jgi:threonine-phosphate decarboxylase
MLRDEQSRFFKTLSGIDGVRVFGGSASFILCQWMRTPDLDDLLFYLLKNGVYVRDCRNFPGLESNFFRIGLRKPDENMRLAALLGSYPEGRA